jgi:cell division protein FtsB
MILRRPAFFLVCLAMLVGLAFVTNVLPFRQILEQQKAVDAAAAALVALQEENSRMAIEVEALHTPGEIERLARENLGYVLPGEIGFVVLEPESQLGSDASPASPIEIEPPTEQAWYLRIWDFLTGADLRGSG